MIKLEQDKSKISVVIPCLNEEKGLVELIPRLEGIADEVLIVDNASTDNTAGIARSMGAKVVYEGRLGYGWAYQKGLPAATESIIVTMDGDGTYPPEEIPGMIAILRSQNLDFINCSRFPLRNRKAMPTKNDYANRLTTAVTNLLFGIRIMDSQSGMWVIRKRILDKILPGSGNMEFSLEIKLNAIINNDVAFGEHHINYDPRGGGSSKYRPVKDSLNIIFMIMRLLIKARKLKPCCSTR